MSRDLRVGVGDTGLPFATCPLWGAAAGAGAAPAARPLWLCLHLHPAMAAVQAVDTAGGGQCMSSRRGGAVHVAGGGQYMSLRRAARFGVATSLQACGGGEEAPACIEM
jgi:hypothetical protein